MSFGGTSRPKQAPLPEPAPRPQPQPGETKAREDLKLRLRKASSRRQSNITGVGLLRPVQELSISRLQQL